VVDLISTRFPGHPLFAVGYSAGSSLLGRCVRACCRACVHYLCMCACACMGLNGKNGMEERVVGWVVASKKSGPCFVVDHPCVHGVGWTDVCADVNSGRFFLLSLAISLPPHTTPPSCTPPLPSLSLIHTHINTHTHTHPPLLSPPPFSLIIHHRHTHTYIPPPSGT
jgi:hypothetical protein